MAAQALSIDPASLYCAFEQVADGRKQKSKRYPLPLLLTLLLLGNWPEKPRSMVSWTLVKERQGWLRAHLNWRQQLSHQFHL